MSKFVFRNNTIERFFGKEYSFSGYDDISNIPQDVDGYVWWYHTPIKYDQEVLLAEIQGYVQKLNYVLQNVDARKTFLIFTMDIIYAVPFLDGDYSISKAVSAYNHALYEIAALHNNVKVIDISEFTRRYSIEDLFDWKFYLMSQMGMNPKLHKDFKLWYERKLESISLKRKKCLILDLDNTLWGGVLGEEGIDGIKIGGDYPGKAFLYFQEAVSQLAKTGVILAVCSKNNENDVLEVWERNPYNILRRDAFAAYRINWTDKATNIKELSLELNIGLDSMVFVDDNPTERELVKQMLPMVSVPEFPSQPYELPMFFKYLVETFFKVYSLTDEDKKKTEQYKANAARLLAQNSFTNLDDFIRSLNIKITIEAANEFNIQRIAQMTQKTNQFNLTTKRYTDVDLRNFIANGWKIWCISVSDKFGDSGITGTVMIEENTIDTFLLSCRILGKGIETVFLAKVLSMVAETGINTLKATYVPTPKNTQVKTFYDKCGFICIGEDECGRKEYMVDLTNINLDIKDIYEIIVK